MMQPTVQPPAPQRHNSAGSSSGSGSGSGGSPPSDEQSTVRNWRQDCVYARSYGGNQSQQHAAQPRSGVQRVQQQPRIGSGRFAHLQAPQLIEELPDVRIGLSPPTESVLLQRRLRQQQRGNDLSEYCEPATASG